MKKIVKNNSPNFFENWKKQFLRDKNRQPTYSNDFVGDIKQKFKYELLKEQGYICCYCMCSVEYDNSHIEHFIPQSLSLTPAKDLDYYNMFISCEGYHSDKDRCGHQKGNWYSPTESISPLCNTVENEFAYTIDGQIKQMNSDRATTNIEKLKLNSPALVRARKTAIYWSGLFDDNFDKSTLTTLVNDYSQRDRFGSYIPFCQAVIYCLKHE